MKVNYYPHITLAETRNIVRTAQKLFGADLHHLSPANLQLLFSQFIHEKGIQLTDVLISRMNEYPDVFDDLLYQLDVPDSEMFRDPEVWQILTAKVIPELIGENDRITIWFPSCSSGDELFSLSILLLEAGLRPQTNLIASTFSGKRLQETKRGLMKGDSQIICQENYLKAGGAGTLERYMEKIDSVKARILSVRERIDFRPQPLIPGLAARSTDLIVFRNKLIYYTPEAQISILGSLITSLKPGGYLVLGYKETVRESLFLNMMEPVFAEEKIYRVK